MVALILAQGERLADQAQAIARLRAELATRQVAMAALQERVGGILAALDPAAGDDPASRPTTMPGLQPPKRNQPPGAAPRKHRTVGFGRTRMTPTARQVHAVAQCPHGATALRGGTVTRTRAVIEVGPGRVEVTAHVYVERRCPRCHGRWLPEPGLDGVVIGPGRLGVGVLSLIATLREELRLPVARIQWYLAAVPGLSLSVGAIVATLHTVAARAAPLVEQIRTTIRASPVVHADETGWRQNGGNGYVWTVATPTERAFVWGGRARAGREEQIGTDYGGVLVRDFYGAYTSYEGCHQYCWAHLPRDGDALVEQQRPAAAVRGWADGVHGLYQRATAAAATATADPRLRRHQRQRDEAELGALCAPFTGGPRRHNACCASASPSTWRRGSSSLRSRRCRPPTTPPSAACATW